MYQNDKQCAVEGCVMKECISSSVMFFDKSLKKRSCAPLSVNDRCVGSKTPKWAENKEFHLIKVERTKMLIT